MTDFERISLMLQAASQRDLLTIEEAAVFYSVSERWLYERMQQGDLPYYRIGSRRRVSRKDIDKYLAADRVDSREEMHTTTRKYIINNPKVARI